MFLAQWLGMTARGGIVAGNTVFLYAAYAYEEADPATLGVLSSLMAGAGIPLTLAAGWLMDRFGRKISIVPGLFVLGAAMAFLGVTSFAGLGFGWFIAGFVVLQTMNSLLTGSWQVVGSDLAPPGGRGRFFAVGRTVTQGGLHDQSRGRLGLHGALRLHPGVGRRRRGGDALLCHPRLLRAGDQPQSEVTRATYAVAAVSATLAA